MKEAAEMRRARALPQRGEARMKKVEKLEGKRQKVEVQQEGRVRSR
jgi:hypothetical protein